MQKHPIEQQRWLSTDANFSAMEYILEQMPNTSLEQLLEQVTQNFQQLLTDLVQYLVENRSQVEQAVKQVKQLQLNWKKIEKKVTQVSNELSLVEKEVARDLENAANSLEEKRRYTECKLALETLRRKNKSLWSAWRFLERLDQGYGLPEEHETENLLKNLVSELVKAKNIQYEEDRITNRILVEQVEENWNKIVSRTEDKLQWWFLTSLSDVDKLEESRRRCLECCKALQLTNKVESWFAEAFVEPFLSERLDSVESSCDRLLALKEGVQELLRYPLVENLKQSDDSIRQEFCFIKHSVLPVVVNWMKDWTLQLESIQEPQRFYKIYVGTEEIFILLEEFEKTVHPQDSVYMTPEYRSLWDPELFRTYLQAVELQLANQLEASILRGGTKNVGKFRCEASEGLKIFLEESWSSKIWIWPITGYLAEWSLLGIARYKKYVEGYFERSKGDISSIQPKDLLNLLLDLEYFPSWVEEEFQLETPKLPNRNAQEIVEDISRLIRNGVKQCSDMNPRVRELLCNLIVTKCTENLQSLRGILASYRMTTKPVPKHHSPFVVNILRPLKDILHLLSDEESLKKHIVDTVCQQLVERYVAMTTEIISSVRKAEDTLKRLNLKRSSAATVSEGVSDLEKIQRQLELDGKKLNEELQQVGFDITKDHLLSGIS